MSTPALQSLEQQVDVETPEQVVISYTIAGVGSRSAAAIIDYAICAALLIAVSIAGFDLVALKATGSWLVALMILVAFAVFWGYYVLFEGLWDGQTPGKRQLGLRVVRDGGYSVTFGASAVRNLLRIVDGQPGFTYGVGILSVVVSSSGKRLGDYAAGTMVVRERAVTLLAAPPAPVARPGSAASDPKIAVPTTVLSDEEFQLLDRFMSRLADLDPGRRVELSAQLAIRFHDRAPELTGSDSAVLAQLYAAEREGRARGAPGHSNTGAAREQHAIVAQGRPRWQEFASVLADAQRRGLQHMPEAEVSDFVSRYRELSGDLARLQTATRSQRGGRAAGGQGAIDSVFYLSRLVAGGHNLLYRDQRLGLASVWDYMTIAVPREIRRSVLPISIAALFLFGPAVIAYEAVVRNPSVASEFIPAGMLERADAGVERAKKKEGYVPIDPEVRPMMASFIIQNNITVTIAAFAGGLTAGIGTLFALASNGVQLGGVLGLYQSKGILHLILEFVAPHGVLELTAITFAGGGGLLLGSALLLPGAMTRREALVLRGQRALRLLAASALLLLVAGTLEGLVSPIPSWTLAQKLAVSAVTAVLLVLYVAMNRGRSVVDPVRAQSTG